MTLTECRALAQLHLDQISVSWDTEVVLIEKVVEYENTAAFFFQSVEFMQTGEYTAALAGNGPIMVHRLTGSLDLGGTALPIDHYITQFEQRNQG